MENTVIQHTFQKFDQSQKPQSFNKKNRTPDKTEKVRSSEIKTAVATLLATCRCQCQAKFLTSAKFLTCCCFSVVLLLRTTKLSLAIAFSVCVV